MKTRNILMAGIAAISLTLGACADNSTVTGPASGLTGAPGEQSGGQVSMLAKLQPELHIVPQLGESFELIFTAGAGGTSDSPEMVAIRSIEQVTFEIYDPGNRLIDSRTTQEVTTSGVLRGDDMVASLTAGAKVEWVAPGAIAPGTYAVMIVSNDRERVVQREYFPVAQ